MSPRSLSVRSAWNVSASAWLRVSTDFAALPVLVGMLLRVADHLVDRVLVEHGRGGDPDLLFLAGRPVLGLHVEDAVGVDVEGDLDLRDAARRRRDAVEDEPAQRLVVGREVALALEDVDLDLRLRIGRGREDLRLAGRDGRVALDQLGHDATERLDAERQRGHVEEQDVLDVAGQDAGLDRRADRHDLVRVDALVRLLAAEHLLDRLDDRRHAGHAADEDHLVDVGGLEAGVLERGLDRPLGLGHEIGHQVLELGPGERHHEVLGAGRVGGDVGQVDLGGCRGRQLDLRLLGGLLEALQGLLVLGQVDPLVLLVLGQQPVDDALVEVVTAEVRVAVGGLDLEDALAELEDRDVEGAAAQVVDGDLLVALLVQAVGQGRRGRLVDDPLDVEAGDPAGVLGRLALGVVEVGRDGDDGLGHLLAQVRLGVRAQLLEDHRADLGRRVGLAVGQLDHHAVALGVLLDVVRDQALAALGLRGHPSGGP